MCTGSREQPMDRSSNLKWVQKQVLYFWTAESVSVVSGYWLYSSLKCTATIFRWCPIDWCLRQCQRTGIWYFKSTLKILALFPFSFIFREGTPLRYGSCVRERTWTNQRTSPLPYTYNPPRQNINIYQTLNHQPYDNEVNWDLCWHPDGNERRSNRNRGKKRPNYKEWD